MYSKSDIGATVSAFNYVACVNKVGGAISNQCTPPRAAAKVCHVMSSRVAIAWKVIGHAYGLDTGNFRSIVHEDMQS